VEKFKQMMEIPSSLSTLKPVDRARIFMEKDTNRTVTRLWESSDGDAGYLDNYTGKYKESSADFPPMIFPVGQLPTPPQETRYKLFKRYKAD